MRKHVAELIIALMIAWVLVGGKVAYSPVYQASMGGGR
jgi:hypothetical protein